MSSDVEMENGAASSGEDDLAYDPDQKAEERRQVRMGYRALDDALNEKRKGGMDGVSFGYLREHIQQSNQFLKHVKAPQEATLDSRIFLNTVSLAGDVAKHNAASSRAFDVDEFVGRLVTFMGGRSAGRGRVQDDDDDEQDEDEEDPRASGGEPLAWDKVARRALTMSRRVPAMDFMLGPLAIEVKERVVKKRVAHEKVTEPERRPQELKESDIQKSENETTKNVLLLSKLLRKQKRINLFKFIIHPTDFAQSVENLFYLSFIIREGQCGLEFEEDGEPVIFTTRQPTDEDYAKGIRKHQVVLTLEMDAWKRAIEVFNITEPIIPSRPKVVHNNAKWYG
ncbi:hypothetical protein EXIGLDRAFT_727665 [Exidia glandulosa HHB12029]|uniref:Non-structural maintenance of chromosomes element 4 n=1 Tax=Exidia glandulosa HHB12029 TaxID=1314781 RepID=A0A165M0J3_EXIGL|nr:hypothetical protein EXIGLDRAFT_727665 [Exidia glandulosa HHB12029]